MTLSCRSKETSGDFKKREPLLFGWYIELKRTMIRTSWATRRMNGKTPGKTPGTTPGTESPTGKMTLSTGATNGRKKRKPGSNRGTMRSTTARRSTTTRSLENLRSPRRLRRHPLRMPQPPPPVLQHRPRSLSPRTKEKAAVVPPADRDGIPLRTAP